MRTFALAVLVTVACLSHAQSAAPAVPASAPNASIRVEIVKSPAEEEQDAEREAKAERHDAEDLKAQQTAAAASEAQVRVGIASLVLTVLGTIGLAFTVFYAKRTADQATIASKAAGQSAASAADTVKVMQETSERQLRAYLNTGEIDISHHLTGVGPDGQKIFVPNPIQVGPAGPAIPPPVFSVYVTNDGVTPAYKVAFKVSIVVRPLGEDLPIDYGYPDIARGLAQGQVAPSGFPSLGPGKGFTHTMALNEMETQQFIQAAITRECHMFVYGTVNYLDVYGHQRMTQFCCRVHPRTAAANGSCLAFYGPFNEAT